VRERDGLALSSRNVYLDPAQRAAATALPAALTAGAHAGARGREAVLAAATEVLQGIPEVAGGLPGAAGPELKPPPAHGEARLLVAAKVGTTRLIDNVPVQLGAAE